MRSIEARGIGIGEDGDAAGPQLGRELGRGIEQRAPDAGSDGRRIDEQDVEIRRVAFGHDAGHADRRPAASQATSTRPAAMSASLTGSDAALNCMNVSVVAPVRLRPPAKRGQRARSRPSAPCEEPASIRGRVP